MPSTTERQRRFMGAELARARAGKKTKTGMSVKTLREFAGRVESKMVGAMKGPWRDVGAKRQTEAGKAGGFRSGRIIHAAEEF